MGKNRARTGLPTIFLIFSSLLSLLWIPLPGGSAQAQGAYDRYVIILAIDSLRADIFEKYAFKGEGNPPSNSILRELSKPDGKYNKHLKVKITKAVFPTYTFAAWASVFTGTYPGKHGIQGQNFYIRDWGKARAYDAGGDIWDMLACDIPDSVRIYGWDINCGELYKAFTAMSISIGAGLGSGSILEIYGLVKVGTTINDFLEKLPNPCITVWVPGPFAGIPFPTKFCLVDFYASGGIQNGDLLKQTLYDYAKANDLNTYNIHNMYNRSNLDQSGNHVPWGNIYGGGLKDMDQFWGRPTYDETRNAVVLPDHEDFQIMDKAVVPKAISYIKSNGMPHVLTMYFACVDGESHQFKWFKYPSLTQAQFTALRKVDLWLIDFMKFFKTRPEYDKTVFLLIADHGQIALESSFSHSLPGDKYMIKTNGYMAHVYIKNSKTGSWKDLPTPQDFDEFMNKVLPDPKYMPSFKDIQIALGRDPRVGYYQAYSWNGKSWDILPLDKLEDSPYEYPGSEERIPGVNNLNRSGDVIIQPAEGVGFTGSPSTHGGLQYSNTIVPLCIFGEPVTKSQDFSNANGPWILCGASHVDITPTVLNIFNLYEKYKGNFDGKPMMNKDFRINFDDFSLCRGSGASDFLYGRWKNFQGESTQIVLHNPSSVSRDAVILYYGWDEDFKDCQIVRLSPHDLVMLDPPLEGGGPVEIRAAPLQKEKRQGGLVGYIIHRSGGNTIGMVQLILDDPELFNIDRKNEGSVYRCSCDILQQKKSPLQKIFCPETR